MNRTVQGFPEQAKTALKNEALQKAMGSTSGEFREKRAKAVQALPEFDELCEAATDIKKRVLDNLDYYLEQFETNVKRNGGQVHYARDGARAQEIVVALCQKHEATKVTKSKSMVTEEIELNHALEAVGIEVTETDLGEYIIQIAGETPSHIIGPALHMSEDEIAELFSDVHGTDKLEASDDRGAKLVREARGVLRDKFFASELCISGANFLVAETGSIAIVTNEGNADLCRLIPKHHIAVTGIEKIVPNLEDLGAMLRVLARSATGQAMTSYVTLVSGPNDLYQDPSFHVVLVDGKRSQALAEETREMLRCIRCGACMNHCPVYGAVGGHAYGWVYPGPIGAILSPSFLGLDSARHLPHASTLCGACGDVCPVRIPIPELLRHWREETYRQALTPVKERTIIRLWAWLAARPTIYGLVMRAGIHALKLLSKKGLIRRLPLVHEWTMHKDFPAPEGGKFTELWRKSEGHDNE